MTNSPGASSRGWCGGLAAAELKKKDEDTDGRDDTESEGLSGGDGSALERGDEHELEGSGKWW